jgi:hypothetical protein
MAIQAPTIDANGATAALLKHLYGDGASGIGCQIVRR